MADIRKRVGKNGITYQVRYPSAATLTGYAFKTFDSRKAARNFTENLGSLVAGRAHAIRTVSQAVDRWLDICERIGRDGREKVEPDTMKDYRRRARTIRAYPWTKELPELEQSDVVQFRTWLLENKSRDLARRTLSAFHSIMIEMKSQGAITTDPAAGITVRSGRYEEDASEVAIPTDAEVRSLFETADQMGRKNDYMEKCWARYRPMIYLAGFSGMRPSEYRGIAWPQVLEDSVIVRQRADEQGRIGPVKSSAGRRTIHVARFIIDMIQDWRPRCPASPGELVFPTEKGRPILLRNFVLGAWNPVLREAGLAVSVAAKGRTVLRPKYTPYALRHYFASKLIEKNRDLEYIRTTMGHAQIETTMDHYAHLIRGKERKRRGEAEDLAADILGRA